MKKKRKTKELSDTRKTCMKIIEDVDKSRQNSDSIEDDFYLTQVLGVPINPYQRRGKGGIF